MSLAVLLAVLLGMAGMSVLIKTRSARPEDIAHVLALQQRVYPNIPPWLPAKLEGQLEMFPQGQVVVQQRRRGRRAQSRQ